MKLISQNEYAQISKVDDFDFEKNKEEQGELVDSLKKYLEETQYVGVSANQLEGLDEFRVLVFNPEDPTLMFNPTIIDQSEKMQYGKESCLNVPGYMFNIYRPKSIIVEYQTETGELKTEQFVGITAKVLCMLIDNLNGITFEKQVSHDELKRGIRKSSIRMKRMYKNLSKLRRENKV